MIDNQGKKIAYVVSSFVIFKICLPFFKTKKTASPFISNFTKIYVAEFQLTDGSFHHIYSI